MPSSEESRPATTVVRTGRPEAVADAPLNRPLVPASTYVAGGDLEYGRYGNPTWTAFEEVLGELEGGRALTFSSGLAAAAAIADLITPGEKVVVPRHAYNGVLLQFAEREQRGLLKLVQVDVEDTAAVTEACDDAAIVWMESPTNPAMEVADLEAIAKAAHDAGATFVVDNTFATPLAQRPLDLGADVVLHSATKLLAGHSDAVIGALVTREDQIFDALEARRHTLGSIPGALESWLAARGVRTLSVRFERAQANAAELARRLADHPAVARVRYPGFATVLAFETTGGGAYAQRVTEASRLVVYATSLGGVESTWERRRRWAGEPQTIPEELIRLSVGIEDVDDLWADIEQALEAAR